MVNDTQFIDKDNQGTQGMIDDSTKFTLNMPPALREEHTWIYVPALTLDELNLIGESLGFFCGIPWTTAI